MRQKKKNNKKRYPEEFKVSAMKLARELGSAKLAAEKLGMKNSQTLSNWLRHDDKMNSDEEYREIENLKAENKKIKKQLEEEKKTTAILKDAMAFFCQDRLK